MTGAARTPDIELQPRSTVGSIDELLAGATKREPMKNADSLSTARFERVVIGGERFVVKYLHCDEDWIMRGTGDLRCRPVLMWESGMFDALPQFLDHTVVNVATGLGRHGWGGALLMRDESEHFVPDGEPVEPEDHEIFITNMARFHAHFWGWRDTIGFTGNGNRYLFFNEHLAVIEKHLGSGAHVPTLVAAGYEHMARMSPAAYRLARDIFHEPSAFLLAIEATPHTFIHSDWKLGNLGNHPDGRTILIDWAFQGEGPALSDLAWYLAVNCDRLPEPKDSAIERYRRALQTAGVTTDGWWETQLGLALLGCFLLQGWSKTLSGERDDEFTWWEQRALATGDLLS